MISRAFPSRRSSCSWYFLEIHRLLRHSGLHRRWSYRRGFPIITRGSKGLGMMQSRPNSMRFHGRRPEEHSQSEHVLLGQLRPGRRDGRPASSGALMAVAAGSSSAPPENELETLSTLLHLVGIVPSGPIYT